MKTWIAKLPQFMYDSAFVRENVLAVLNAGGVLSLADVSFCTTYAVMVLPVGIAPNSLLKDFSLNWQELSGDLVAEMSKQATPQDEAVAEAA